MPPKQSRKRSQNDSAARSTTSSSAPGRDRAPADRQSGVRPSSGAGSTAARPGQVDVRRMIAHLNRDGSPTKRQRAVSVSGESSASEADDPVPDEQMAAFRDMLQRELQKQTKLLTDQFQRTTDSLKEELLNMQQRIGNLERHVNDQGETIQQLYEAVDKRDARILLLEGELEETRREGNCPYLTFSGPGVPTPPKDEPWKENVATTTRTMLQKYMPDTEVKEDDIVQCYRVDKGKTIVCRFSRWGQASVRDRIYDNRVGLTKDENGQRRDNSEQLYVNERLTQGAAAAYRSLREEKKRGRIHSVYTKHGAIYVRMKQYGAKVRVHNRVTYERVMRGEC